MASHNLMFIDLELNKDGNQTTDIVQIGWCIGSTDGALIHKGMTFVKPTKPIDPFITELCGITDTDVEEAPELDVAILKMINDHEKFKCARNLAQWGEGDFRTIKEQLKSMNVNIRLPFGIRTTDVKTVYQSWAMANSVTLRSGLTKSMKNIGINPIGLAHRADDDAHNTFLIFCELLNKLRKT